MGGESGRIRARGVVGASSVLKTRSFLSHSPTVRKGLAGRHSPGFPACRIQPGGEMFLICPGWGHALSAYFLSQVEN